MVLVANKWDLVGGGRRERERFVKYFRESLPSFYYVPVIFTSALKGWGVKELLPTSFRVYGEWTKRVATSYLNRFFEEYRATYSFPTHKGKELKVYFVAQVGTKPPTFRLYVNDQRLVKKGFLTHFERKLRDNFSFEGTPLRFLIKERSGRKKRK